MLRCPALRRRAPQQQRPMNSRCHWSPRWLTCDKCACVRVQVLSLAPSFQLMDETYCSPSGTSIDVNVCAEVLRHANHWAVSPGNWTDSEVTQTVKCVPRPCHSALTLPLHVCPCVLTFASWSAAAFLPLPLRLCAQILCLHALVTRGLCTSTPLPLPLYLCCGSTFSYAEHLSGK